MPNKRAAAVLSSLKEIQLSKTLAAPLRAPAQLPTGFAQLAVESCWEVREEEGRCRALYAAAQ